MDLSDSLSVTLTLTAKGDEEILNRTFKLDVWQRSILFLLKTPQTIEAILQKRSSLKQEEVFALIGSLTRDGFVNSSGGTVSAYPANVVNKDVHLLDEIIISEARFMLVKFCVDSFQVDSQGFVNLLGKCKNVSNLQICVDNIYSAVELKHPDQLPKLKNIIMEINTTA